MSQTSSDNESLNSNIRTTVQKKNFDSTITDMYVDMIANTDKLVDTEKRWMFNHNNTSEKKDDNLDYTNKLKTDYNHKPQTDYNHKPQTVTPLNKEKEPDSYTRTEQQNIFQGGIIEKIENKTSEELMLEKLDMLRKLGELSQCGVKLSQRYSMSSDLNTMKYEYELHKKIRSKRNAVNWMSSALLNCIMGIEFLSEKYNPFDFKLKGWHEQMNADQTNYYDVFGELYEKYSTPGGKGMPPELKLLLMITGSAIKLNLSNKLSGMVGMKFDEDADPELVEQLRQQAVAEKLRKETEKKNKVFNEKAQEEHNMASQKAADIQMLREKEREHLRQQKKELEKQARMAELKKKMDEEEQKEREKHNKKDKSDSNSDIKANNQPIMKSPSINDNMKKIFGGSSVFGTALENIKNNYSTSSESSSLTSSKTSSKIQVSPNLDSILKSDARPPKPSDGNSNITATRLIDKDAISSIYNSKKKKGTGRGGAIKIK